MSSKNKVVLSGVVAAVIAIALVGAVVLVSPELLTNNSSSTSSISTSGPSSGSGTLAVLMTDPPTVPDGVTAVYITYSDVQVHVADDGNQSGWNDMHSSGEINLMSVINSSQTIASANISSGKFNGLRFNVTSAVVTFQGTNYTADLVYQQHTLYVWIPGGISVEDGQTAGAMIDMTPTVLLLGTPSSPTFAFIPSAIGYTLSAQSVTNHPHVGDRDDYHGAKDATRDMTSFENTSASLSSDLLKVTVHNNGNSTIVFRMVSLTATSTLSGGWVPSDAIGAVSKTSEFFVVAPNGSLVPMTASTKDGAEQTLEIAGFTLAPGANETFSYNGQLTFGAFALLQGQFPTHPVTTGQKYIVTVLGSGEHAQTAVIAGGSETTTTSASTTTASSSTSSTSTSTTSTGEGV